MTHHALINSDIKITSSYINQWFHFYDFNNNLFSSGRGTGPNPTPPQPTTTASTTTDTYSSTTTAPTAETTSTVDPTTRPVDPSKDACKVSKFDSITEIDGELHFFEDG